MSDIEKIYERNIVSQEKIDRLKSLLKSEGFVDGEDFDLNGNGGNSVVFTVTVELDEQELPEALKPFAWSPDEVERSMYKGNREKRTWNGANFEIALQGYASDLLHKDPECVALEATLDGLKDMSEFKSYEAKRRAIWERICAAPEIVAWEKDLEENYL